MPEIDWDSKLYDRQHHFVSDYGADVLQWLAPQPGEHILDVGCGTGQLAAQIAERGAEVLGIDASENMVSTAKANYLHLHFEVLNATQLPFREDFDAVFSNATFHWIDDQQALVKGILNSLKSGGRLVAEFGGKGNVKRITDAVELAAKNLGLTSELNHNFWFFPNISDYTALLENLGFEVEQAWLFDRLTPLSGENGMYDWITQFAQHAFVKIESEKAEEIKNSAVEILRPSHYVDGTWFADYRRLRIKANKE